MYVTHDITVKRNLLYKSRYDCIEIIIHHSSKDEGKAIIGHSKVFKNEINPCRIVIYIRPWHEKCGMVCQWTKRYRRTVNCLKYQTRHFVDFNFSCKYISPHPFDFISFTVFYHLFLTFDEGISVINFLRSIFVILLFVRRHLLFVLFDSPTRGFG